MIKPKDNKKIMKKVLFLVVATTLFFSCGKENVSPVVTETPEVTPISLTASFEPLASGTKADINNSNQLVWRSGDKIGIYVTSFGDKNQPFHLDGAGGTTTGSFVWDYDEGNFTSHDATVAFFPWHGTNSTDNNVYEGTMYFKLRDGYYDYTSGQMLTPLVAQMSYNSGISNYNPIEFKHAGAAVKVIINNLPAGAKSIGLSAENQQIRGDFHINPVNAGSESMSLDAAEDKGQNSVWLNFTNDAESVFTFLFPVPALASQKLSFNIYDTNNILVWSTTTSVAQPAVGRAQVLAMPALNISYYSQFVTDDTWSLVGKINGANKWEVDQKMYSYGESSVTRITLKAGDEFKIRKNKAWSEAYPGSNYSIGSDGVYTIFFNHSSHDITVLKDDKCQYPFAENL